MIMKTTFKKPNVLALLLAAIASALLICACNLNRQSGFELLLAESGELILSDNQISAYYSDNGTLELNEQGILKWNSYQTYPDIPKLNASLFGKDFIIKIKGKKVVQGKFWSNMSSSIVDNVVIVDSIFKLDNTANTIRIQGSYPGAASGTLDMNLKSQLIEYFSSINKLKMPLSH
jgi:hypothetical protein